MEEGGADRDCAGKGSDEVGGSRGGDQIRSAVLVDLLVAGHQTRVRLGNDVGSGAVGGGTGWAVRGVLEVDQVGVDVAKALVVDAKALRHAGTRVDQEDVHLRDQPMHDRQTVGILEIEDHPPLAAIEDVEALALAGRELSQ